MQHRLKENVSSTEFRPRSTACGILLLCISLLPACAAGGMQSERDPEKVALAMYRADLTLKRDAILSLSEYFGEKQDDAEPHWGKSPSVAVSEAEMAQLVYDDAVRGVAVDPRLRRQFGQLFSALMELRLLADCRTTGAKPLAPSDAGNARVSVSLECMHPTWNVDDDDADVSQPATKRMAKLLNDVQRGIEGQRTVRSIATLELEQHNNHGRREWMVDQGADTAEAVAELIYGNTNSFGKPFRNALQLLRSESARVFENAPWEKLPADGLGAQNVVMMAVSASNSLDRDTFLAYWTAVGKPKVAIERKLWPAAVEKRRALTPQRNWVESDGGRHWPIFEASLKALEAAVCEAGEPEYVVSRTPDLQRSAIVTLRCAVPALAYSQQQGWEVNTKGMAPLSIAAQVQADYRNVKGVQRWVADERSTNAVTVALFRAVYLRTAGGSIGSDIGKDPCSSLLLLDGGEPDTAECR